MSWFTKNKIYLDYASATPTLREVRKVMDKYWTNDFYNSSAIYSEGLLIKEEVRNWRTKLAHFLGVSQEGVIFTSGGTEANNLAILGTFERWREETLKHTKEEKPHIIISAIEHSSIIASAKEIERRGGKVSIIGVNEEGVVSPEEVKKLLRPNTFLVSIALANGEIGTIQAISKIGRIIREYRKGNDSSYPYFHTDASQAVNYLDIRMDSLHSDLLTLDGSKIYGPKGVGALILKREVELHPIIFGGRQEGGRRAGTISPGLIAGFVRAFEIVQGDIVTESKRLEILRKYFIDSILKCVPKVVINGSVKNHLPNIVSLSLPGTISELVLLKLEKEGLLVSVGSACSYDEKTSGSPVINALGRSNFSESTLRFSFGRMTRRKDIKRAVKIFCLVSQFMLK